MGHHTRILIVDDEPAILRGLQRAWSRNLQRNHQLVLASSIERALHAFDEGPWFPIVVFDVCVPEAADGLRLASELIARAPLPRLVAMSSRADRQTMLRLGQLGVCGYVDKLMIAADPLRFFAALESVGGAHSVEVEMAARACVGERTLADVKDRVAGAMYEEAVARGGSLRAAARLLGVNRQAIQNRNRRHKSD